jgi:glutathione S-transferase
MKSSVTLFGLARSVYTRIAAITLLEKGVDYVLQEVEIFGPDGVPREHFARHPFGRIPVLQHDDMLLYETQAICRYVDEAFDGPPLQPSSPVARARMVQTIGALDAYGYRPMVWDVFVQRVSAPLRGGTPDETAIANALPRVFVTLDALDDLIGEEAFIAGKSPSLADFHAYPMLAYLAMTPEGKAGIATRPSVSRWLDLMSGRPSVQRTRTPYELGPGESSQS